MGADPLPPPAGDYATRATGLPRLGAALADIPQLARDQDDERTLGVIAVAIIADAALYRLTPEAAQRLRQDMVQQLAGLLRPKDRLYAVCPWEWLIVLPELFSPAALTLAMVKLRGAFDTPLPTIDGDALALTVVCGAATWPADGDDALHLVQSARIACLAADRRSTGHECYERGMEHIDARRQELYRELQLALAGGPGLCLHLQPQIDLATGACTGGEALLRWRRDNGDWVPPPHTLAAVEQLGLRNTFTRWLLQQAMQIQIRLAEAGIPIVLSINLSANDLLDMELPDLVAQALATWEIEPGRILLEITETLMVEETEQVMDVLQRLRGLGLNLSIDDFGTGYAGMSYLQRLPVQEVKIDQTFIRRAVDSGRDREIIASIAQLAQRLHMTVVAEGVESAAIAAAAAELGCQYAQGYFYSPALAVEDFIAWWRNHGEGRD